MKKHIYLNIKFNRLGLKILFGLMVSLLFHGYCLSQNERLELDGWLKMVPDTGATSTLQPGTIRLNQINNDLEGYTGDHWLSLTAGDTKLYPFGEDKNPVTEKLFIESSDTVSITVGFSVAVDGDYLIAGAPNTFARTGAAYIFQKTDTGWVEMQKLEASDGAAYDYFGWTVSISGSFAVIGSPYDDFGSPQTSIRGQLMYSILMVQHGKNRQN